MLTVIIMPPSCTSSTSTPTSTCSTLPLLVAPTAAPYCIDDYTRNNCGQDQ